MADLLPETEKNKTLLDEETGRVQVGLAYEGFFWFFSSTEPLKLLY